jgi:TolB-like protein/DNA-binding winged helix-turn-helix (wHTH) protein/Flp pilus assembly protein TadD
MPLRSSHLYKFGVFSLDPAEGLLTQGDRKISLTPKAFQTLLFLVENAGRVVEKEELLQKVWPDTFVEEATLAQNVFTLRKQLGDDRSDAVYIETVPKRGYRFAAPVEVVDAAKPSVEVKVLDEPVSVVLPALAPRASRWRWIAPLVLAVIVLVGVVAWRVRTSTTAHRPLLIVLPMENLTGDPSQEFLSDGLTEELIAQLGSLDPSKLGVIARTSSMTYKGSGKTVPQIARELKVDYLLEGSIREAGGQVRVTAQLIRVRDQTHLWAQSYDRDLRDMLKVQTEIAESVASSIELQLTDATRTRLASATPVNPDAYQAYLQGRYYWNTRTRGGLQKSVDFYNQALGIDPANARAYAGLADAYNLISFYGYNHDPENVHRALAAANKAVELDERLADGHASVGYSSFYWWWDWPKAEHEFLRAMELDDNYLPAHQWYALYLAAAGRQQESLNQVERAKELDPLSPAVRTTSAYVDYFAGRYQDAFDECEAALAANPKYMPAFYVRGLAYEARGNYEKAIADFQNAISLSNAGSWVYFGALGHAYAKSGRRAEAEAILAQMEASSKEGFVGPYNRAVIWAGLNDQQQTLLWLHKGQDAGDAAMTWLRVDPRFDFVRSDSWVKSWPTRLPSCRTCPAVP